MAAPYDCWAPWYDLLNPGLPGEAEFYVGNAMRLGGPVLEMGVGTGRLALPMAMGGLPVVGVDNSAGMLRRCAETAGAVGPMPGQLHLVAGDMRSISLRRRFTTITLAYRTFMHMLTWEDRLACLANLREHLAVGGRILMNLWAARREHVAAFIQERNGVMERVGDYDAPEDGSRITQFCSTSYDLEAQLLHEENLIYECAPDGEVRRTLILPMVRGWLTPGDMAHVVERAGLEAEAVYGDFDATPFTPEASEMVWILKQAGDPG